MRASVLLIASLLTCAALAGCASSNDTATTSSTDANGTTTTHTSSGTSKSGTTTSGTTTTSSSSSSSTKSGPNHPPTGSLSASIQTGTLPLNVTFTLKGTDQDGDKVTWSFDADGDKKVEAIGNGSVLPKTVLFQYLTAGNYSAVFSLNDGVTTTSYNVTIGVTAAGASHIFQASGSFSAGSPAQGCKIIVFTAPGLAGQAYGEETLPKTTWKKPYTATFTSTGSQGYAVGFTGGGSVSTDKQGAGPVLSGTVLDQAATAIFAACGGADITYDFVVG